MPVFRGGIGREKKGSKKAGPKPCGKADQRRRKMSVPRMPDKRDAVTIAALAVMRSSGVEKESAARKRDMVKPMPARTPAPRKWDGRTPSGIRARPVRISR